MRDYQYEKTDLKTRMELSLDHFFSDGAHWFMTSEAEVNVAETFREALDRIRELEAEVKRLEEKASAADVHRMEMIRWAAAEVSS